jgi:sugar phosphate isomerase/epimerase
MDSFENEFTRKIDDYAPYISVIYLSDKTKDWKWHLIPGDWMLDLKTFLKRLKKSWYSRPISVKLDFKPTELANKEKLRKQLKKVRMYYDKYFLNMVDDEDDEMFEEKHETKDSE